MFSMTLQKARHIVTASVLATGYMLGPVGTAYADDMGARSTVAFIGGDARQRSKFAYVGLIHHFSADSVSDGPLLRVVGYYASYDYDTTAVVGGRVDADAVAAEAMAGYQKVMDDYILRGYIGLDYEKHDLSPDNLLDSNRGSDTGVRLQGEFESDYSTQTYVSLIGSYGSAKDSYWARIRGGHDFSGYIIGGEGMFKGNNESDETRVGAFLMTRNLSPQTFTVSAGYSSTDSNRGGGSPYVTAELSTVF